jgi:MGT family glycosyltransferase
MLAEAAFRQTWHFGVLSFTGTGHLNPLITLSQELKARGHKVTFFEKTKIESRVRQAGLEFFPLGESSSSKENKPVAQTKSIWSDLSTLRFNLKRITKDVEIYLRETPAALARAGVDALIVNEIAMTGPTVAELLRLPYFIISTSVPHNFGWDVAPWSSMRRYSGPWFDKLEKTLLELSALRMRGPIRRAIDLQRWQAGLAPVRESGKTYPWLAQITQLPQCLDFPRAALPDNFHYTGPFVSQAARPAVEFPWERIDGRPMIYASLGTTRTMQPAIFQLIAEACRELDLQLVLSLGGRMSPELLGELPGKPLVVRYAPQLELLRMAKLVITHGGPNTVFESLMEGKPMVAIPVAHDQPAIAARLERLKLAEVLPVKGLSAERIRAAVMMVVNDGSYRDAAAWMQATLRSICGVERAVDVIEQAMETNCLPQPCAVG